MEVEADVIEDFRAVYGYLWLCIDANNAIIVDDASVGAPLDESYRKHTSIFGRIVAARFPETFENPRSEFNSLQDFPFSHGAPMLVVRDETSTAFIALDEITSIII